jgi:hypothetical protein
VFDDFDLLIIDIDVPASPSDGFVKKFLCYSWIKLCYVEGKEGVTRFVLDVFEPVNDR